MSDDFKPRVLGRTGVPVGPLGVGASYGIGAKAVEEAFDRGVNYFYWAWMRKSGMRDGLRNIFASNREKVFLTITSLIPTGPMIRSCVDRARKALNTDYIDGLQFFLRKNRKVSPSLQLDTALSLKERGVVRFIGVTGHHRPNFPTFANEIFSDFLHVRYNAIHRGAETDVFPKLPPKGAPERPGTVAFTVTSWKQIIKATPSRLGGLDVPTAGDCYRFALSNQGVDICLTGPADDDQMRHALEAVEKGPMTDEELDWMRKVGDILRK